MKDIIVIGDLHGHETWKDIVEHNPGCIFVFVGDYFDSFTLSPHLQKKNFDEILAFKRANPDDVILLMGNHDLHYYIKVKSYGGYAGYNGVTQMLLDHDLDNRLDKLVSNGTIQACYQVNNNILISHAGVSYIWLNEVFGEVENAEFNMNNALIHDPHVFKFNSGVRRNDEGDDITQSPMWIRPNALVYSRTDHVQIFGHTPTDDIVMWDNTINVDTLRHGLFLKICWDDAMDRYYKFEKMDITNKVWQNISRKAV